MPIADSCFLDFWGCQMKKFAIKFLEYWPFIAIYVMIATCIVGIYLRAPHMKRLLFSCVPIGLWTLFGIVRMVRAERHKAGQQ